MSFPKGAIKERKCPAPPQTSQPNFGSCDPLPKAARCALGVVALVVVLLCGARAVAERGLENSLAMAATLGGSLHPPVLELPESQVHAKQAADGVALHAFGLGDLQQGPSLPVCCVQGRSPRSSCGREGVENHG